MTLSIRNQDRFRERPAALLIDLDDTLYPYAPSHEAALRQVRSKAERLLAIATHDFDVLYDRARREVKQKTGQTAAAHNRLLYFQRMVELAGLKTQVLTALDFEQTYWRTFLLHARLFDQVIEFLDDMRLIGAPIVIVTDLNAQIQFRKIVHFGLDHYVDYVVTSEEAGADKPNRAPFEIALEKIGAMKGPVWFIGENPESDIAGAMALSKFVVIQKLHAGVTPAVPAADATFGDFGDLRKLLKT